MMAATSDLSNNSEEDASKEVQSSPDEIVKQQEQVFNSKYPGMKVSGASALLQKRLHKGQKYFDSGDYNVAKAKIGEEKQKQQTAPLAVSTEKALLRQSTGDEIPTPENLPKPQLVPSKLTTDSL